MNFPLFIARRIYQGDQTRKQVSKPAMRIATLGVAIGLAVMIVSVSVVIGFKHSIRDKVVGFGSHIQITNFLSLQSQQQHPVAIGDSMIQVLNKLEGVEHVQRFILKQGILKTDEEFLGVVFKGVGPEFDSTFIASNLVEGNIPSFSDKESGNKILISKDMAAKLRIGSGEKIFAYFIDENGLRRRRFTIAGVYQTNLSQYDETICFTDLYTTVKLCGWEDDQVTGAELTVRDFNKLQDTYYDAIQKVNRSQDRNGETFTSQTIQEINPQIFSWLNLLDMNVWIILILMIAVACVTMISGLLIIILERTNMIGIMKALGARNKTIRHTFLWFATFMIGKGLLWGNIISLLLVALQKYTGLVKLDPQTYYVNTVPVEINIPIVILINLATLLICMGALIAPSFIIAHIKPAKSMRYE